MMISRAVMDRLKAQYAAEGRFGPASDLFYLPDDLLMEEYDAALLGQGNSYALGDCTKEAIRRELIAKPARIAMKTKFQWNILAMADRFQKLNPSC